MKHSQVMNEKTRTKHSQMMTQILVMNKIKISSDESNILRDEYNTQKINETVSNDK